MPLSPLLFNIYTEELITGAIENTGVVVGWKRIEDIRFADDQATMADTSDLSQKLMDSKCNIKGVRTENQFKEEK